LVYALDEDHRIVIAHATAHKTRTNAPLVRVTLDNERAIVCTPDHEFMRRDGTYRQAQDLVPGTSLMPFSLERDYEGYMCVRHPGTGNWKRVHAYNLDAPTAKARGIPGSARGLAMTTRAATVEAQLSPGVTSR